MEHTSDPAVAREIAMDHLTESPTYYQDLKQMERKQAERKQMRKGPARAAMEKGASMTTFASLVNQGDVLLKAMTTQSGDKLTFAELEAKIRRSGSATDPAAVAAKVYRASGADPVEEKRKKQMKEEKAMEPGDLKKDRMCKALQRAANDLEKGLKANGAVNDRAPTGGVAGQAVGQAPTTTPTAAATAPAPQAPALPPGLLRKSGFTDPLPFGLRTEPFQKSTRLEQLGIAGVELSPDVIDVVASVIPGGSGGFEYEDNPGIATEQYESIGDCLNRCGFSLTKPGV
jgi:hypothetical protein